MAYTKGDFFFGGGGGGGCYVPGSHVAGSSQNRKSWVRMNFQFQGRESLPMAC